MAVVSQLVKPQFIYIHKETSNQSFLDMHHYLKSQGIQNNDFFLGLLDVGLAGIDPRDPNLPTNMKARVMNECRRNYWYFLREVVRIPDQGGTVGSGRRYKLHRGNLAMNFLFTLNFNQYVELPRQHGKTVAAICRYLWVYNFGTSNSEIMFIHKDHGGSKGNLKSFKNIRDSLPSYLQMSSATNAEGKKLKIPNTVVMIQHPYNNNKITTFPSARTREAANNLGRGATMPLQYYDEFAFMPYNKDVYLAATPAFSTASKNAQSNNAPYGILITSTPGDLLTDSGAYAFEFRNRATPWNEHYYDLNYQQLQDLKNSNTESSFFLIRYSYLQLGSGQDYFKKMVIDLGDYPAVRREVLLEWAKIANNCPFTQEELDKIKEFLKQPIRTLFFGRFQQYQFNVYEDLDTNYPPIIGVDVAGATYKDSSAITIIDSKTTRVTATLNCNYMPADDLAEVLYQLIVKYLPNGIINIERNGGFGLSVIQRLCKTSVKKNLYWEIKDKIIEESYDGIRVNKRPQKVRVYGTDSTKDVRARLIEILRERVNLHKDKFIAPILHDEMQSMEVKKNGKVEHSDNSHDDQVFSYLMALYVWYEGKDLAERYHIIKNTIKTDQDIDIEELGFEDSLEAKEHVDLETSIYDPESEIAQELEKISNDRFITSKDARENSYMQDAQLRDIILATNKEAREKYSKETGVSPETYQDPRIGTTTTLPDSLFLDDDGDQNTFTTPDGTPISGNLASLWNRI
jgi:hypothetical protein